MLSMRELHCRFVYIAEAIEEILTLKTIADLRVTLRGSLTTREDKKYKRTSGICTYGT